MPKPITNLAPLNIIRTETVLSKLPIHNLANDKRVNIQITKKNERGQMEVYWKVSANEEYGLPGRLAYKIDTLIINRRIDEIGRPLPKIILLGSINDICLELGMLIGGRTACQIRNAILQNVGALINAKLTYKAHDGTERLLESGFTRYSVVFTGERLPNGKKADAVYLILNDPYWEVLNNAPFRPLNYDYLKELTPSAQRFYEIISYRMFVAIKYDHLQATLLYSDFCTFSAQTRYYDYQHFRKQMYKIHKPHLTSTYIGKVEYEEKIDAEGRLDWLMRYTPGPKAIAEYEAFNGKQLVGDGTINVKKQKAAKKPKPAPSAATAPPDATEKADIKRTSTPSPALELVQSFHKLVRDIDNYQPYPGSKEKSQAETLLATYGLEKANFVVTYAVAEARKTNFSMRTFGAIYQYLSNAIAQYERREQQQERQRAQEEAQRQHVDARLQALERNQYRALYNKVKKQLLIDIPSLVTNPEGLQSVIKTEMMRELASQEASGKK